MFYRQMAIDVFGSMANLPRAQRKSQATWATWKVFLSKKRSIGPQASIEFSQIDPEQIKELEEERDARNAEARIFRAHYLAKLTTYPKYGPLGSVRKNIVVDTEQLYQYLNKPESRLTKLWEKESIYEFARSKGAKLADYEPNKRRRDNFGETLLPGDTCRRCANR